MARGRFFPADIVACATTLSALALPAAAGEEATPNATLCAGCPPSHRHASSTSGSQLRGAEQATTEGAALRSAAEPQLPPAEADKDEKDAFFQYQHAGCKNFAELRLGDSLRSKDADYCKAMCSENPRCWHAYFSPFKPGGGSCDLLSSGCLLQDVHEFCNDCALYTKVYSHHGIGCRNLRELLLDTSAVNGAGECVEKCAQRPGCWYAGSTTFGSTSWCFLYSGGSRRTGCLRQTALHWDLYGAKPGAKWKPAPSFLPLDFSAFPNRLCVQAAEIGPSSHPVSLSYCENACLRNPECWHVQHEDGIEWCHLYKLGCVPHLFVSEFTMTMYTRVRRWQQTYCKNWGELFIPNTTSVGSDGECVHRCSQTPGCAYAIFYHYATSCRAPGKCLCNLLSGAGKCRLEANPTSDLMVAAPLAELEPSES